MKTPVATILVPGKCLLTNEDMQTARYREEAASAYIAKTRTNKHAQALRWFLFLLAFFVIAIIVLIIEVITY